jgi:hypothetical protein
MSSRQKGVSLWCQFPRDAWLWYCSPVTTIICPWKNSNGMGLWCENILRFWTIKWLKMCRIILSCNSPSSDSYTDTELWQCLDALKCGQFNFSSRRGTVLTDCFHLYGSQTLLCITDNTSFPYSVLKQLVGIKLLDRLQFNWTEGFRDIS